MEASARVLLYTPEVYSFFEDKVRNANRALCVGQEMMLVFRMQRMLQALLYDDVCKWSDV